MVVDLGKADVLVRPVTQLIESGIDADRAGRDGVQQGTELLVYGRTPVQGVD